MSWIKRNIGFVIGSLVALGLLGVGGYYLLTKISNANGITEEIQKQYAELDRLNKLNPHPGSGKIDNVKIAKEQEQTLRAYMAKVKPLFERVPPIPDSPKISNAEFAAQLRNTVAQLHKSAEQASVQVPKDYYFTFEAQRRLMLFDSTSLEKLAVHLGEIRAISEILFSAKVNALEAVRRELVSTNDTNPSDYFSKKTTSTPLADITPYEFTFKCFSPELAQVLSGLANSPNGFVVKSINIEPAAQMENTQALAAAVAPMYVQPQPVAPTFYPPPGAGGQEALLGGRGAARYLPPPAAVAPPVQLVQPTARPGGMTTVLNERPLKITMTVEVVKIKSATK
jgi:hypothetical protein